MPAPEVVDLPGLVGTIYQGVEPMIWKIVNAYHRKYGGRKEELMSTARLAFMHAVHTWDASKGAFTTHVHWQVYYSLYNEAKDLHRQGGFARGTDKLDFLASKRAFDLDEFLGDLSEEARAVAKAALALATGDAPRKEDVAGFLMEAGWCINDVLHAFSEIREALE